MSKREVLSTRVVTWMKEVVVEQKWEENLYRVKGRKIQEGVWWELIHILWTAEQINNACGEHVVYHHAAEKKPITCANKVYERFMHLKQQDPWSTYINIGADEQGREAIHALMYDVGDEEMILLDYQLQQALLAKWLRARCSSYEEFQDKEKHGSVFGPCFHVAYMGHDEIQEAEMQKRVGECATTLHEIYLQYKRAHPYQHEVDVYADPVWKQAIHACIENTWKYGVILMAKLHKELTTRWFSSTRSALQTLLPWDAVANDISHISSKSTTGYVSHPWFRLAIHGVDTIKNEWIDVKTTTCAHILQQVYHRIQQQTGRTWYINICEEREWQQALIDMMVDAWPTDMASIHTQLNEKLRELHLLCSHTSYDALIHPEKKLAGWFELTHIDHI